MVLLLVGVTVHGAIFQGTKAAIVDTESLVGEVDTAKANFQMVTKGRDHCTTLKVDCSEAKCCKTTRYKYIERLIILLFSGYPAGQELFWKF